MVACVLSLLLIDRSRRKTMHTLQSRFLNVLNTISNLGYRKCSFEPCRPCSSTAFTTLLHLNVMSFEQIKYDMIELITPPPFHAMLKTFLFRKSFPP